MIFICKLIRSRLDFFLWFIMLAAIASCPFLLSACGDSGTDSGGPASGTGTLSFRLAYHGNGGHDPLRPTAFNCVAEGVAKIEALVYGPENDRLQAGGPWDCAAGKGTIASVPIGSSRTIVLLGKNNAGEIVFYGQKTDINIVAGSDNSAGTIDCYSFIPALTAPENQSQVYASTAVFTWNDIAGATEYNIIVSENGDLTNPIINTNTTEMSLRPTDLTHSKTYYWRVVAIDTYNNEGMMSELRSFTVENSPPEVRIESPAPGSTFTAADQIQFAGSGNDWEDGPLDGTTFLWSSQIDGPIGTGATFSTGILVAGTHQITLAVTDTDGATETAIVTIYIPAGRLPDTGQTDSYTDTPGEDSDYTINPPAYTKLDASGRILDDESGDWAMVRDNVTGLIWEVKTDDGGTHDRDNTYTWQDAQDTFIVQLNNDNFGGHSDWRLPTIKELYSIVNKDLIYPAIDTAYFPNTMSAVSAVYWSSNTYLFDTVANPSVADSAWWVRFNTGDIYIYDKLNSYYVRAVRGGQNDGALVDNGDGTVTDTATGLMWQQAEAEAGAIPWVEALTYCETLELAGYDDWRLPNSNELQSIVDYSTFDPAIDTTIFPEAGSIFYWTSTTYADIPDNACDIQFKYGDIYVSSPDKSMSKHVRAVRGRQ